MSSLKTCFAVIILMLLQGQSEEAFGQVPNRRAGAVPSPIAESPPPPCLPAAPSRQEGPPPDFSLRVYFGHNVPAARAKVYQPIKDFLNKAKLGVPNDRIAYFRTVISPDAQLVSGWSGMINSVTPVQAGVVVDLRIFAVQSGMYDTANIIERYSIINGKVNYLGFYVPNDTPRVQIGF